MTDLTSLIEKLEKAEGPDRWLDAKIDAALRIGSIKMQGDGSGYDWAWEKFPVWAHHTQARGMCGVRHESGDLGLVWDSQPFTSSIDAAAEQLKQLLNGQNVGCRGLLASQSRPTSVKTRIVAHQQQVVRIDREARDGLDPRMTRRLVSLIQAQIQETAAVIVGDYGKGVVTQSLLDQLRELCRRHGVWLSLDPKPVHRVNLAGLSLITPNRKETFELANLPDETRHANPLADPNLLQAAEKLLRELRPAVLLITLSEAGMLLCRRDHKPFHIPTLAQEVFDVSGAGDTVIATFTAAIAAGASPIEAAILSNHAAGIVVGKIGTATATPEELLASFKRG